GLVEYERFNYPKPATWPFEKPLIRVLKTRELTFNWNTAGAGYALRQDNLDWFALNRTGCLPVSYIPEGVDEEEWNRIAKYEQQAYDYFAGQAEPYLVRVAEYAGAYQLFRHFRPTEEAPAAESAAQRRGHQVLAVKILDAMNALREADPVRLGMAAARVTA